MCCVRCPSAATCWPGVSNLLSGLAGVGYTGSYIFSQTTFSMRMKVDTPLMGAIVTGELSGPWRARPCGSGTLEAAAAIRARKNLSSCLTLTP